MFREQIKSWMVNPLSTQVQSNHTPLKSNRLDPEVMMVSKQESLLFQGGPHFQVPNLDFLGVEMSSVLWTLVASYKGAAHLTTWWSWVYLHQTYPENGRTLQTLNHLIAKKLEKISIPKNLASSNSFHIFPKPLLSPLSLQLPITNPPTSGDLVFQLIPLDEDDGFGFRILLSDLLQPLGHPQQLAPMLAQLGGKLLRCYNSCGWSCLLVPEPIAFMGLVYF